MERVTLEIIDAYGLTTIEKDAINGNKFVFTVNYVCTKPPTQTNIGFM